MKKFLSFFFCLLATTAFAQTEYDVEYYSETPDAIQLNVKVYNVKEKEAEPEACRAAVETVLFEGVKESRTHKQPIIRNKEQAMQKNGPYLHRFLDEGGYKTFIKGCIITDKGKDTQKRKYVTCSVNVLSKAMRQSVTKATTGGGFGF